MADFEMVGLTSNTNGRCYCVHDTCGKEIAIGEVLRLVPCAVSVHGVIEEAVKCVKVTDGVDTCTVAFVPRAIAALPKVQNNFNEFATVTELCGHSKNKHKRDKSHKNGGMAAVVLLDEEHMNE